MKASRQKQRCIATAIAVGALALAACSGPADPQAIQGTWALETVVVDGEPYDLPIEYAAGRGGVLGRAQFDETGILWFAGPCNDGRGEYEFDGRRLLLTEMMHSAGYCFTPYARGTPQESLFMDAEEVIFVVLRSGAVEVVFSGAESELMHLSASGTILTFRRDTGD
jgi:hypothetical protein